jgi:ribosome-binding factor A
VGRDGQWNVGAACKTVHDDKARKTRAFADRPIHCWEDQDILVSGVSDPRLGWVSVTDVRVDRELASASIYVSSAEGSDRAAEILDGLEHASGFLRRELAQRIELRSFPRLRFIWDPTPEQAERIERLIASLHDSPPPDKEGASSDG